MPEKKKQLIQPVIKVAISAKEPEKVVRSSSNEYHMVALRKDGTEKLGSDFTCSERAFEKVYKSLTEKPDGNAEGDKARFRVKKSTN